MRNNLSTLAYQVKPKEAFQIVSEKFPRLDISLDWIENFYYRVMKFTQEKKMTEVGMQLKAIKDLIDEYGSLSQNKLLELLKTEKGIDLAKSTLRRRLKDLKM